MMVIDLNRGMAFLLKASNSTVSLITPNLFVNRLRATWMGAVFARRPMAHSPSQAALRLNRLMD
jgi:hypothetical protein